MPATRSSRPTLVRLFALLAAAVLLLASCSNSSSDDDSSGDTTPSGPGGDVGEYTGAEVLGDGPFGTFEEISGVPGVTDDEIKVALLSTGEANPLGYCLLQCQADGIQAYFDWRNSQGGVMGRDLVLDVIDDEFANNKAKALEIIDGGEHFAVIGSPVIADGFPELTNAGIPVFASAVQSDLADGDEYMFTPVGTTCILCAAPRNIWPVKDAGASKVGILGFGVAQASKDCVAGTKASFDKFGADEGIEAAYVNDELPYGLTNGVGPEVTAMKRAGVDFISTCMDQNSVIILERELDRQGMGDVPVVLPNAYGDQAFLTENADLIEGDYIGVMYRPFEADPAGTDLEALTAQMEENGTEVTDWGAISWINADLLFRGILAAGPQFDQEKVVAAINTFTESTNGGLVAAVDWTKQHDAVTPDDLVTNAPELSCFAYVKVESGKTVLLGDEEKPHFCWDPADETYEEPVTMSFAHE